MKSRARRILLVAALLPLWTAGTQALSADLPLARLLTVFPPGGKAGTTFDVTLTGLDLDDATHLYFSHSNITSKPKIAEGSGLPEASKFILTVASNVPPGVYEARVVGQFGASNPRAFVVGDLPEVLEAKAENTPGTAMDVPLDTVVNAQAEANAVDYFKFKAGKGQRVVVQCQAKEIDSRMDAALILQDGVGRELERSRRGGLLDFTPSADGEYVLKVHDFIYRGGGEYFYRLTIGTGPHLDFIFPPSGVPGTKSSFVIYGRNLPGGRPAADLNIGGKALEQLDVEIELPNDPATRRGSSTNALVRSAVAVLDGIEYRLDSPRGVSNPVLVGFATAPVVAEQEPNSKPESAQRISLPCEFVGQFYPQNDRDWLAFEAKKDDVYWVEVFSQRLGLPTDPLVVIQRVTKNSEGEEKAADLQEFSDPGASSNLPEFKVSALDPAGRFEVKEDGTYRAQIRDLFNRNHSDPRHVYRLSLRQPAPDFRLVALPYPPQKKDAKDVAVWTPFLRRGETIPIKVLALRREGFKGEIQLTVENLPPGVRATEAKIATDGNTALVFFTAEETAAKWVGPVRLLGKAKFGDHELIREARGGTVTWNVNDPATEVVQSRVTRDFVLAVSGSDAAPISISAVEDKLWETAVGDKLKIPIKVVRRGEFNANLKLKAAGLPALDAMKEIDVDGKATEAAIQIDLTQQKIPPGTYSFYLQTQTQGQYRRLPSTELATADEQVKAAEAAAKQAEKQANDLGAEAKKAKDPLSTAAQALEESEAVTKAAAEKLAVAQQAASKDAQDEKLAAAVAAAEKESADAAAKSKTAAEAKATAEKSAADALAKAKEAEMKKAAASARAKEIAEKAKPKEVTATVYSTPIRLKVAAAEKAKSN